MGTCAEIKAIVSGGGTSTSMAASEMMGKYQARSSAGTFPLLCFTPVVIGAAWVVDGARGREAVKKALRSEAS